MNVSSINYLNNYQYSDTSSQNEIQENNVPNLWNMKVKSNNENFKDLVSSFSIVGKKLNLPFHILIYKKIMI